MQHLFIVDPLAGLNVTADTTVAFMREAARRGHEVSTCEVHEILASEGRVVAHARPTSLVSDPSRAWYASGEAERNSIALKSEFRALRLPVISVQVLPASVVWNTWPKSMTYAVLKSSGSSTMSRTVLAPGYVAVAIGTPAAVVRTKTWVPEPK